MQKEKRSRKQLYADEEMQKIMEERMQLLDTIKEMVRNEVDRRMKELARNNKRHDDTNRNPSFIPFKSEQSLEPSTDFVQLLSRCAHVSSKALWATARCNGNTDDGKRIKAVRKHANNNKSKQMRYNDQLGFNI